MMRVAFRITLLCFGFLICNAYGTSVASPVLPIPKSVTEGKKTSSLTGNIYFDYIGLDKKAETDLSAHWNNFKKEFGATTVAKEKISLVIIGKNKDWDASLKKQFNTSVQQLGKEGYLFIWNAREKVIAANTETGLFYGLQTLRQLIRAKWDKEISIADWPSFEHRAVYDDISRGPISSVDYIKQQIERLAEIKVNALSFYIEHVVQPLSHPDFAPANGKLTIPQIKELSAYAAKYHMQLVGSFQSFGHFEKILALPQYKEMGETSTMISPLNPTAKKFLESVIGELCEAFGSPYFNVNCDETFDLGKGKSKAYVDSIGKDRYYADHIIFLHDVLKKHHKKMMMWGDIALEHESILDLLPKDITYLTWVYDDKDSYAPWITPFKKRGLEFMVCPGILNSYRMFPDVVMAKGNINGFLNDGKANGATGAITTIWDDGGTYLFSGDWYGVYVAAEKSWNAENGLEPSFDKRYEQQAYATNDGRYVQSLFKLMELRSVPVSYNLNDQVWRQKLLPEKGKKMLINNSSVPDALRIISASENIISTAKPNLHASDINTLKFSISQYKLIMDSRMKLAQVAGMYKKATTLTGIAGVEMIKSSILIVDTLKNRYSLLRKEFEAAWLKENQAYWLDVVLASFDRKMADLNELGIQLNNALTELKAGKSIPVASALRLDITESSNFYFQNWMLGGPFPLDNPAELPGFLYSENKEYNIPPSPGDFTHYKDKTYRWQKFASQDGGIIDLDENYAVNGSAVAYAYCNVFLDSAIQTNAYITSSNAVELFCNGTKVYSDLSSNNPEKEHKIGIALNKGLNHILIKLPRKEGKPWTFSFRLDESLPLFNHKHKYKLDSKLKKYEAD